MGIDIKKQLINQCLQHAEDRIGEITSALQQAQEAIESDTKSSAGDKYETSREMIQQDINRYQMQLTQAKKDWILLQKIELEKKEKVEIGAVAITDRAVYFIAVSLGKQTIGATDFMVISPSSPIGSLLLGCTVGDHFTFNKLTQTITAVS